jgi:hypothetical protein
MPNYNSRNLLKIRTKKIKGDAAHDDSTIRLRTIAPGRFARAGGEVDGAGEIQFRGRQ